MRTMQRDLAAATSDRYTGSQAARDLDHITKRLTLLEKDQEDQNEWIRSIRDRLIGIESDVRTFGIPRRTDPPIKNDRR